MSGGAPEGCQLRPEHKPWRCSYDVEDPRAKVFRPIGDGTMPGALDFIENYVRAIGEYADFAKQAGRAHAITANVLKLVDRVLRRCTDFETGRCEPSLERIMQVTGFCRPTVVALLARARKHGLLDWVRRTEETGAAPGQGPKRRQTSNAYFFEVSRLPIEALRRLRQLLARKKATAREWPERVGSGPVPNKAQRMASKLVRAAAGMLGAGSMEIEREWREKAARVSSGGLAAQVAMLYPGDPEAQRAHLDMLDGQSASSRIAPVSPSDRTNTS